MSQAVLKSGELVVAETVWVRSLTEFRAAGGAINVGKENSEITLTLPAGFKFAFGYNLEAK
jgi:hypothetical protein